MAHEKKGMMFVLSSPSGAGKTTLAKKLADQNERFEISISYTTRKPRPNEVNGKDYFFVTKDKFLKLDKKNYFIETAKNFNNLYGSPYKNIINSRKKNIHLLFDIDWKGARKIRKNYKKEDIIDFFILPPSKLELRKRLVKRARDSTQEINLRLSYAINEMKHFNEYKYVLVNDKIKTTVNNLVKIINHLIFIDEIKSEIKNYKIN